MCSFYTFVILLTSCELLQLRLNRDGYIVGTEYISDLVEEGHTAHGHGNSFNVIKSDNFHSIMQWQPAYDDSYFRALAFGC